MSANSSSSYSASESTSEEEPVDGDSRGSDSAPSSKKVSEDTMVLPGESGNLASEIQSEIHLHGTRESPNNKGKKGKKKKNHPMYEFANMAAKFDVRPPGANPEALSRDEVRHLWDRTVPQEWARTDGFLVSDLNFAMLADDSEVEGIFLDDEQADELNKEHIDMSESEDEDFSAAWSAEHLYKHLTEANAHSSRTCTTKSMLENFEGMEEHEAEHLLEMADEWYRADKVRREIGYEDMLRLCSRVDSNIREGIRNFTLMPKVAGADANVAENTTGGHAVLPFRDDMDRMLAKMCYLKGMAGLGTAMMDSRIHNKEDPRYQEYAAKQPKWRKHY
jgi:hypothetical protein